MMKVQRLLTGPMGLRISVEGDRFTVQFQGTSTAAFLRVQDWGKDSEGEPRSLVLISALILRGVTPTPALYEWVARTGGSRWFGHIEVLDDKEPGKVYLIFSHTLLGDFLDEKELSVALFGVIAVADEWDDQLQKQFGGKRWADA
jgi:hypothetical protein